MSRRKGMADGNGIGNSQAQKVSHVFGRATGFREKVRADKVCECSSIFSVVRLIRKRRGNGVTSSRYELHVGFFALICPNQKFRFEQVEPSMEGIWLRRFYRLILSNAVRRERRLSSHTFNGGRPRQRSGTQCRLRHGEQEYSISQEKPAMKAEKLAKAYRVEHGKHFRMKDFDPTDTAGWHQEQAGEALQKGIAQMAELQDKLYAQDQWSLLLVIQAMDAAGKDGLIKHVMSGVNPEGCQVYSFFEAADDGMVQ